MTDYDGHMIVYVGLNLQRCTHKRANSTACKLSRNVLKHIWKLHMYIKPSPNAVSWVEGRVACVPPRLARERGWVTVHLSDSSVGPPAPSTELAPSMYGLISISGINLQNNHSMHRYSAVVFKRLNALSTAPAQQIRLSKSLCLCEHECKVG